MIRSGLKPIIMSVWFSRRLDDVDGLFRCIWIFGYRAENCIERRRGKQRVQPVRDADTHGAFRFAGLRLQVAGDRIERMIEPAQGLRERLALLGQLDPRGSR